MAKTDKKAAAKGKDKDKDKRKWKAAGKAEANSESVAVDPPVAADAGPPTRDKSEAAFAKAKKLMPGGVSSPVRAYSAVGGTPVFLKSAAGPRVTDLDGQTYIDYVGSYGPAILGHAPDHVVAALTKAASHGTTLGAPTEAENRLAELIVQAVPSIELVRFVNSGT